MGNKPPEPTKISRDTFGFLQPLLRTLEESYKVFIEEERTRITNKVANLEKLLEVEFGDQLAADASVLAILEAAYGPDAEVATTESQQ